MNFDEYIDCLRNELEDINFESFNFDEIYNCDKYTCLEPRIDNNYYLDFNQKKFVFNYPFAYYYVDIKFYTEFIQIDNFDLIKIGDISIYNLILDSFYCSKNKIKILNNQLTYLNNMDFSLVITELYKNNPIIESIKIYLPKNHNMLYYGCFYLKDTNTINLAKNIEKKHKISSYIFDYNKNFTYSVKSISNFIMQINKNNSFDLIEYIEITYDKIIYLKINEFYTYSNQKYSIEWSQIIHNKLNIKYVDFYKIPIKDDFCEKICIKLFNIFNEDITSLFKIKYFII